MEPINHIEAHAEHIRLGAEAKSRIRERLMAHMRLRPLAPMSPYQRFFIESPYLASFRKPVFAALALVLIVGIGGGTTFAAEGALPGSPLYALKTKVLEPARVLLAASPQEKAAVKVSIALARVQEAEQLAVQGKLTAQQGKDVQETFDKSLGDANTTLAELGEQDEASAASLHDSLAISLDAHEAVLDTISTVAATTSSEGVRALALHVRGKTDDDTAASDSARVEDTQAASKAAPIRAAVMLMSAPAQEAVIATSSASSTEEGHRKGKSTDERKRAVEMERDSILHSLGL